MVDLPLPLLLPIGAVLAACITGAVSFVSLVISKEQKTSEFRQAWIDALRADLAEFSAQARRLADERTPINLKQSTGTLIERIEAQDEEARRPDPLLENRRRLAQTYYALRLRLNLSENDHQGLLEHLDKVYWILNSRPEGARFDEVVNELDIMSRVAQTVLKREWIRVKEGEPTFRFTVGTAKWIAIVLGLLLVGSLTYAVIHALGATS